MRWNWIRFECILLRSFARCCVHWTIIKQQQQRWMRQQQEVERRRLGCCCCWGMESTECRVRIYCRRPLTAKVVNLRAPQYWIEISRWDLCLLELRELGNLNNDMYLRIGIVLLLLRAPANTGLSLNCAQFYDKWHRGRCWNGNWSESRRAK